MTWDTCGVLALVVLWADVDAAPTAAQHATIAADASVLVRTMIRTICRTGAICQREPG
jgi:hypothetical protein